VCVCVFVCALAHTYYLVGVVAKESFSLKKYKRGGGVDVGSKSSLVTCFSTINVTLNFPVKFIHAYTLGSETLSRSHVRRNYTLPVTESITIRV
jgi:hypothetical protein